MTGGYKIKDIAERSGFTPATLRYYEEIGLLPEAIRTPAGYRVYDDGILDRLSFIARAKQLGCTLEEIADLSIAWDGGRCGPVQDRLREVVADKLASSQRQIVELMTLSADLQRAAATLELHRPDGPCDERCGCITDAPDEPTATAHSVSFVSKPVGTGEIAHARTTIDALAVGRVASPPRPCRQSGVHRGWCARHLAGSTPLEELMRLTAAEQSCCQFFASRSRSTDAASRWRSDLPPMRSPSSTRCSGSGVSTKKQDVALIGAGAGPAQSVAQGRPRISRRHRSRYRDRGRPVRDDRPRGRDRCGNRRIAPTPAIAAVVRGRQRPTRRHDSANLTCHTPCSRNDCPIDSRSCSS